MNYKRAKAWWRRRKRGAPQDPVRSDLTRTGGRFFSPTSPLNLPLTDGRKIPSLTHLLHTQAGHVVLGVGAQQPIVVYSGPNDPTGWIRGLGPDGQSYRSYMGGRFPSDMRPADAAVVVDFDTRTVHTGLHWRRLSDGGWTCEDLETRPLDDPDGWGSLAAGLVLERELLAGKIPHVVAIEAPDLDLYGRTVRLTEKHGQAAVAEALHTYGGLIVGITDEPYLIVRCEHSQNAMTTNVGATYRMIGIGADLWPTRIPIDKIEVIA